MRRSFAVTALFSVIAAGGHSACQKPTSDTHGQGSDPSHSSCQAWDRMASLLSHSERDALARDGAVYARDLIIGENLLTDCNQRAQMASYFGKLLRGENLSDTDRQFAATQSEQIVSVLRRIWPTLSASRALIRDGDFSSQKYNLLSDSAVKASAIGPLLSDILDKESIGIDHAFILLSRPMLEVKPAVFRQLERAEKAGDIRRQIYALAVLERMGEATVAPRLRKLYRRGNLSSFEKKLIPILIAKVERGENIVFSDVEDLEYLDN
jgi:hypothetical protein